MNNPMGALWAWWIFACLLTFGLGEAWGWWQFGQPGTLSAWIRYWSAMHPTVPYALACSGAALLIHFWN